MASVALDSLIGGGFPTITRGVTVAAGQTLKRGSVVGIVTASGEAKLLDKASSDGSQNFFGVLAQDVDTTAGATVAPVYLCGVFLSQGLTLGGATVVDDVRDEARVLSCYIVDSSANDNVMGG